MLQPQLVDSYADVIFIPAAEITMFDDNLVVYKCLGDLMFYVTGSDSENELILYAVLQAFYEATSALLRCAVEQTTKGTQLSIRVQPRKLVYVHMLHRTENSSSS